MIEVPQQRELSSVESQTLEVVRGLLAELGLHRAAESASLESSLERDLGLGSLERVELLVRLERRLNARLPDEVAQRAETPADWVRVLLEGGKRSRSGGPARYVIRQPSRPAPAAPDSARTWVEILRRQTETEADRVHIHLLEDDSGQDITYGQLLEKSSRVAWGLLSAGLRRDETVAIMLPTCADFFYAFFGVIMAGGIAVPIYPPAQPGKIEEYVRRQVGILRNAEVRFLISFDRVMAVSKIMRLNLPTLREVTTIERLAESGGSPWKAMPEPSDVAFIQYTSGSTGDPKGVVLTHSNVLENVRGIGWAVKFRPTDTVVSWLPLYHDMGLIGSWLFSLYFGPPITVLSPLAFLSRPERWLWALHDSRGTLCPAPNFSYELCTRRIPDEALEGLDLSCWRVAINAGEAVLPETLERFARRFEKYGFRPESYVPCYGLAESSVALTFPPIDRRPVIDTIAREPFVREGRAVPAAPGGTRVLRFVANGRPLPGHEVRLMDEGGRMLGERLQGRLQFRGPSTTPGYYRNPEATKAILTDDGWIDSGDLAYWASGELYITGREKDCIIKAGRNIIPQEVESATAEVAGVRRGCVAAFGSRDRETGTERLVVVAETRATAPAELQKIEAEIVRAVDSLVGLPPDQVVLVPPQTIPKTSSGKIRRNETRSLFERGLLRTAKRPPWLQFLRLWLDNLVPLRGLGLAWKGVTRMLNQAIRAAWLTGLTRVGGTLARLLPKRSAAPKLVRWTSRWALRACGLALPRCGIEGGDAAGQKIPAVLFANRVGPLDPLVLAAILPSPFRIADASVLRSLPSGAAFLLRPLVVDPAAPGAQRPPGGTLRERIRRALEEGYSVLVLSEGPVGAPAHQSRFRLDGLDAARQVPSPLVPIALRATTDGPTVRIGPPIPVEAGDSAELSELRERVRKSIALLCQPTQ